MALFYFVEMCPKPNSTRSALSKKSHIEDLEGIPGLFKALTDVPDEEENWSIFQFPVDFDANLYGAKTDIKFYLRKCLKLNHFVLFFLIYFSFFNTESTDQELDTTTKDRQHILTFNCTVVYMSQCLSWNKCKTNCQSMGATSYR